MLNHKISIFFLLISQILVAQNVKKCNTTFLMNNEIEKNEEYLENRKRLIVEDKLWINQNSTDSNKRSTITIPIVVHVIHRTNHANIGSGTNISDARIEDAIRILNEDYSKTNPEFPNPPRNTFLSSSGNPNLEFCLATIDPSGNPTNGITRTSTTQTNWDADDQGGWGSDGEANAMKKTSSGGIDSWDYQRYLNIWVCDLTNSQSGGMTLGYAYLPGLPSGGWSGDQTWKDGLVVDFQWFGTIQGASGDGRTATHEIGHYLGLNHTFCESQGGGCCDNDDNNVDDTPLCYNSNNGGPYFGPVTSNTNNNTCNDIGQGFSSDLLDMDENFMAYSQNTWMFSHDQVNAMNATLNGVRSNLKNSNVTVNCTGTVNTNNISENNKIKVYPNPTTGKILIRNLIHTSNNTISIRNIVGKIIFTADSRNNLDSLDISHLEDGVYFIEIVSNNALRIEKVILAK